MTEQKNPQLTRDELIIKWIAADADLARAKVDEARLRRELFALAFPNPKEGMNTVELGNSYKLKADYKYNYSLKNKDGETRKAIEEIEAVGNEGVFLAERLVKWSPDLSLTEWRNLDKETDEHPQRVEIKKILERVLTISPGMPSIEFVEPKGK